MEERLEVIAVPRWVVVGFVLPLFLLGVTGAVSGTVSIVRTVFDNAAAIRELKTGIDALANELRSDQ